MKGLIKYFGIAFILFLLVYWSIGIIKMPADDMRGGILKEDILLYRKFLIFPNHSDIVIYKSDYFEERDSAETSRYLFIQRVIGLPGDTVFIDSNVVYINHQIEKKSDFYQKNYIIQLTDSIEKLNHLDRLISEKVLISKKTEYAVSLSEKMYQQLKQDTNVIGITYELEFPSAFENEIFPYNEKVKWNKHFFGPIYLPQKGDKIKMDGSTIPIYFPIIQEEEKLSNIQNDSLFINGKHVNEYIFKNDYYFVMGDNRDNAIDSRYLGPVKRKDMVGIVFAHFH
ncbi:MAG: signal peptidase I [Bacteroidia bacterium]|nr:signal peptidase I [Bacteroidia bacterium]